MRTGIINTTVIFHLPNDQGRIQEFEKGGGTTHCLFVFRTAASLEASKLAQVPKKLISGWGGGGGGGGTPTLFSGAPSTSRVAQVPKKLISGGGGDFFFPERHLRPESRKSQKRVAQVATGV